MYKKYWNADQKCSSYAVCDDNFIFPRMLFCRAHFSYGNISENIYCIVAHDNINYTYKIPMRFAIRNNSSSPLYSMTILPLVDPC